MSRRLIFCCICILIYLGLFIGASIYGGRAQENNTAFWSGTLSSAPVFVPEPVPVSETKHVDLNGYWLEKINELRLQKNLRPLVIDSRLIETATVWATEMQKRGEITHTRTDGKTMHQWIDTKSLAFTKHGAANGWRTNYFVENIARFYAEPSNTGLKQALDKTLDAFLSEGPGGDHYESIYHPDWNSVGLGYSYVPSDDKTVRVYFAFHYGSLEQ